MAFCPSKYGWSVWSATLGSISPCFYQIVVYGLLAASFAVMGGYEYIRMMMTPRTRLLSVAQPNYTTKVWLTISLIALHTVDLVLGMLDPQGGQLSGFQEVHNGVAIFSWGFIPV